FEQIKKRVEFPYHSSSPKTDKQLGLLYNTQTNFSIDQGSQDYVRNAQVYFSFDVAHHEKLVGRKFELVGSSLYIKAFRLLDDPKEIYKETEIICLLNSKECSGKVFATPAWWALRNEKFWSH